MRLKSLSGKLAQLRHASPVCWTPFVWGWINRGGKQIVPCVVPGCRGLLYVPAQDFYDSYEFFCEHPEGRHELEYFMDRVQPGDVFYDVGAFRGIFAVACKLKLGQGATVHAFEPIKGNVEAIESIRQLNHFSNFTVAACALGDGEKLPGAEKDDMLRASDAAASRGADGIDTISLDRYLAAGNPPPTLMKIDVEGYELQVMRGARDCLKKHRPRLWMEVHPHFLKVQGKSHEDVLTQLREIGYNVTFFEDREQPGWETSFHVWCV